jgi:hypothetical protein
VKPKTICIAALLATSVVPVTARASSAPPDAPAAAPELPSDRFVGAPRPVAGLGSGTHGAFLEFTDSDFIYRTGIDDNPDAFASTLTRGDDGTFTVELASHQPPCDAGAVGHYAYALSPQGSTLTVTPIDDECQARALAISGNWWSTRCWLADRDCLGPVEPGTYMTNRFNPFGDFTFGELEFTLPAGWAVCYDSQAHLRLIPTDTCGDDDEGSGLRIWHDVAASVQDCSVDDPVVGPLPAPDAEFGAAGIADFLQALSTLSVQRAETVVSGLPAVQLDVTVATNDEAQLCQGGIALTTTRHGVPQYDAFGVGTAYPMRLILVDVDAEHTVGIYLDDTNQEPRLPELARLAAPVIASFRFHPTPPTTPGT